MNLRVEDIVLHRGARVLQNHLSFTLNAGECLWVKGPNGVGKTTLLSTILGLNTVKSGEIFWNDAPIASQLDAYHAALGYFGHQNGMKSKLTAVENLRFWAAMEDVNDNQLLDRVLEDVGLATRRDIPAGYLSSGQKRRLGLARLLLLEKSLYILDEPSVGLDEAGTGFVEGFIARARARGAMVVLTNHTALDIPDTKILNLHPIVQQLATYLDPFLAMDEAL